MVYERRRATRFWLEKFSVVSRTLARMRKGSAVTEFFLRNSSAGESVSFGYSEWGLFRNASKNDVAPTIFVANASDSTKALVASWPYGRGVIYYLADSQAVFGGGKSASEALNLVGWNLDYGIELPANATQVFIVQRPLLIQNDFRQPALFHLIVWS